MGRKSPVGPHAVSLCHPRRGLGTGWRAWRPRGLRACKKAATRPVACGLLWAPRPIATQPITERFFAHAATPRSPPPDRQSDLVFLATASGRADRTRSPPGGSAARCRSSVRRRSAVARAARVEARRAITAPRAHLSPTRAASHRDARPRRSNPLRTRAHRRS